MAFGHFLMGSHNFMVTALGSWLLCEVALRIIPEPCQDQTYFMIINECGLAGKGNIQGRWAQGLVVNAKGLGLGSLVLGVLNTSLIMIRNYLFILLFGDGCITLLISITMLCGTGSIM